MGSLTLGSRTVDVWTACTSQLARHPERLPYRELDRARQLGPRRRAEYLAGRVLSRFVVSEYTGIPSTDLVFDARCARCGDEHGKPRLVSSAGTPIEFSISHTGDTVAVAIARGRFVGVDVEQVRSSTLKLATVVLTRREQAELQSLTLAARARAMTRCWTMKESLVKATGEGLAVDLRSIDVTLLPGADPLRVRSAPVADDWRLATFSLGDVVGAVATRGEIILRRVVLPADRLLAGPAVTPALMRTATPVGTVPPR